MKILIVAGIVFCGLGIVLAIFLANHLRQSDEYRELDLVK